jgi:prepilin-type processing-associated H-X9-DG protein
VSFRQIRGRRPQTAKGLRHQRWLHRLLSRAEQRNERDPQRRGQRSQWHRLAEITDGTSNTFLFLEAVYSKNQSWLPQNTGSNHFMWVHHPSQGYAQGTFNNLLNPPNDTQFNTRAPASGHPGGVQVTYCDGRVGFVSNNVDFFNVYLATYTRAGGEPLSGQTSQN